MRKQKQNSNQNNFFSLKTNKTNWLKENGGKRKEKFKFENWIFNEKYQEKRKIERIRLEMDSNKDPVEEQTLTRVFKREIQREKKKWKTFSPLTQDITKKYGKKYWSPQ